VLSQFREQICHCLVFAQLGRFSADFYLTLVEDADTIGKPLGDFNDLGGKDNGPPATDGAAGILLETIEAAWIHS